MATSIGGGSQEGGRRFLAEKLPDNSVVFETPDGFIFRLSGAFELHSLALENKLKGREEELTEDIINATCTINGYNGSFKEATPLWLACYFDSWESAVLLLSKGADPNRQPRQPPKYALTTPIWLAAWRGSLETVQELLKHGARLDRDGGGLTPLDVATNREIIRLLKKAQNEEVESMVKELEEGEEGTGGKVKSKRKKKNRRKRETPVEKREDEEEEGEDGAEREEVETRASVELPDEGGQEEEEPGFDEKAAEEENEEPHPLKLELEKKEIALHNLFESHIEDGETKAKEMAALLRAIDQAEDEKQAVEKKLAQLQISRDDFLREVEQKFEEMQKTKEDQETKLAKLLVKKEKLEKYLDEKSRENHARKLQLENEIEEIKTALEETPSGQTGTSDESLKKWMLQHFDNQIESMKEKLQCPVCFELASAPIFCCLEQHLICSDCLPKVRDCPLCRVAYPAKPIRNRLMEEIAEELSIIEQKRATLLGS